MSEQTNPDIQQATASNKISEKLKANNEVYDQAQGKGASKAIQQGVAPKNDKIVQDIADEDRKGNRGSYLYNELLNGIGSMASGLGDVALQVGSALATQGAIVDTPTLAEYRREGAPLIRDFLIKNIGAELDGKLKSKYQKETFTAALGGLANSAPAIAVTVGSGGLGSTAMFLQSYDNALQSIDQSEEGQNLDNTTKTIFATSVGTVVSALEKYGLNKIFKEETGVIANLLTKQALKQAAKETNGKVTGDVLTKFLDKGVIDLSNKYIKGGVKALDGAVIEYGTEFLQEGAQAGGELLVNKQTGKSVFDTSETGTWKGFLSRMNKAGVMGAIGGGFLGSVAAIANLKKGDVEGNEKKLEEVNESLNNEGLSEPARQLLTENKIKIQDALEQDADKVDKAFEALSDDNKEKVLDITDRKVKINTLLADEAIPDSIKKDLTEEDKLLDKELEVIAKPEEVKKEGTPITRGSDVTIDDTVELVNGKQGKVTKVEGNQVTMTMENGATFMATPEMVEMTKITPKEAVQETISVEPNTTATEAKETIVEPENESYLIVSSDTKSALDSGRKKQVVEVDANGNQTVNEVDFTKDDADLELDRLESLAKKGRLTPEEFQRSFFGQSTTTTGFQSASKAINENPTAFIENLRKSFDSTNDSNTQPNEVKPVQAEEVVKEDISQKRNEEVLTKAEDDLTALKQVTNKVAKHEASLKRLTEAKNKGEISEQEFTDLKNRFDDVLADSLPANPKRLSKEENEQLNKELEIDNLTTDDFVEYERANSNSTIEPNAETVQQSKDDATGSRPKDTGSETTQEPERDKDSFSKLVHKNIQSEEISNTLNNVERETGRTLDDSEKEYQTTKRMEAIAHGAEVVREAKVEFGDDYATNLINYLDENKTVSVENRSLITISLELDLEKRILEEPENAPKLEKQLKLVRDISTKNQRSAAIATGYGILRHLARVGYDVSQVTNEFFSSTEREARKKLDKTIQSDADAVNKEAEKVENDILDIDIEEAIAKGVEKQVNDIYEKLPSKRREQADKAIAALDRIQKKLRSKTYDASIGVPVAIIDAGITTIKAAIKAGVSVADAIELGINKIKEAHGKKWAKEKEFRQDMLDGFKEEKIDVKEGKRVNPKTDAEKLADAKERVKERIKTIQQQIADKKKELTAISKVTDPELQQLEALESTLKKEAGKYLTNESKALLEEQKKKTIVKKLENEIADIDKQISEGEKKTREAKKDPYESPEINRLKAEKKAKLEVLELIDPTPVDFVRQALIESGYGREIKVKGETKTILDWKKLAGEEGSIDRMRDAVGEVLKGKGYSDIEIERLQDKFTEEYNDLRASIIEKSLNELNNRNTEKDKVDVKASARRLAELYNYGLFDKEADTYDYLMNSALGMSIKSQQIFFEAKEVAKALSDLYSSKNKGKSISDIGLQPAINTLNHKITHLLNKIALNEANWKFKVANIAKEYVGLSQRFLLVNLKNMTENIFSGYVERVFSKLTFFNEKTDTKALRDQRRELATTMFKDITLNGGLDYGNTNSPFLSRSMTQDFIDSFITAKSKDQAYHAMLSYVTGRAFLEGTDSMHKSVLTEKLFVRQLVKVLTNSDNPNHMDREEAVNYVSEQLTGQTFKDAQSTAKEVIDNINSKAGKTILPDNKEAVYRLANSIVKDALVAGTKLNTREVEASLSSAYKVAGFGMGHEANNPISKGVGKLNVSIEQDLKKAIQEKKWNTATALTFESMMVKNIMNPFVGGGMNWVTLTLQKAGLGVYSAVKQGAERRENPIDLTTMEGIKNLEKSLTADAKAKSTQGRVFIGAVAGLLTYAVLKGTGGDDDLYKWLKKNEWVKKYFNVLSPQMLVFLIALKNDELKKYAQNILNVKTDQFSDGVKFVDGATKLVDGIKEGNDNDKNKGLGKLGDVVGGKLSFPLPYKFTRDIQNLYNGLNKKPQINAEWNTSGFLNGFYRTGLIEFLGLRPDAESSKPLTKEHMEERMKQSKKKAMKALEALKK